MLYIYVVLALLLVALLVCAGIAAFVGWKLTHPAARALDEYPQAYGLVHENVQFPSRTHDVTLQGWFLPTKAEPANMTIILSHGYSGNRLEKGLPALSLVQSLVSAGYNVLMYDFRNSGESGGALTTVGFLEKQDLLGAIDWVRNHVPGRIGLIGFSMGATTSILAAAEDPGVSGVVADSPFHQLKPYLQDNLSVWSRLPSFPFTRLILTILPRLTGIKPEEVDALQAVDLVYPRPILFIHSEDDQAIPYTSSEMMWQKHTDRFDWWRTAQAPHVGSYSCQPQAYISRVIAFFQNC